jgi:hypothetical protein
MAMCMFLEVVGGVGVEWGAAAEAGVYEATMASSCWSRRSGAGAKSIEHLATLLTYRLGALGGV